MLTRTVLRLQAFSAIAFALAQAHAAEYWTAGSVMSTWLFPVESRGADGFAFAGPWSPSLGNATAGPAISFGRISCEGSQVAPDVSSGECTALDKDNDLLEIRWQCQKSAAPESVSSACEGRFEVTCGTGKFTGAQGQGSLILFRYEGSNPGASSVKAMFPIISLGLTDEPGQITMAADEAGQSLAQVRCEGA